jgi:hypothetical protein
MVDVVVVEVDGLLDQPEPERVDAEVEIRLGLVDRRGHVVEAENSMRHVCACVTSDAGRTENTPR